MGRTCHTQTRKGSQNDRKQPSGFEKGHFLTGLMAGSKSSGVADIQRDGVTVEKLLSTAKARGFGEVTQAAITRWRRVGLLPEGWIEYRGRNGTRRLFPPEALQQLLGLCHIHLEDGEKRLTYVGWRLWWDFYDVRIDLVRQFLKPLAEDWDKIAADVRNENRFEAAIEAGATINLKNSLMRRIRKRVGSPSFGPFLAILRDVLKGEFSPTRAADVALFEKAMGLTRGRIDHVAGSGPWLGDGIAQTLGSLSQSMQGVSLLQVLDDASDDRLAEARARMKLLVETIGEIGDVLTRSVGRGAYGLTVLSEISRSWGPSDQGTLLLNWLAMNADESTEDVRELEAALEEWNERTSKIVPLIEELVERIPAFKEVWKPRRVRAALSSRNASARLNADLARVCEAHADEVQGFLKDHPEALELLNNT